MFNSRKFSVRITSSRSRAITRVILLAALLAALGMLAPNAVVSASTRTTSAPSVPPNAPQAGNWSVADGWSALPNHGLMSNSVFAFAFNGTDLYVGGTFGQTFDTAVTNLNYIAKLSTTSNTWSALPHNGLNVSQFGGVRALASIGSDLYVGGNFTATSDGAVTNLNGIAKFSTTSNTWSALPHNGLSIGVAGGVYALAVSGTDLYVGGNFTQTYDGAVTNLNYIAKFNTTSNTWSALPNKGLNGIVYALAVSGTDLYVGGYFTAKADGTVGDLTYIAKFSGGVWSALPNKGLNLNGFVKALAVSGSDLYVGGYFTQTYDGAVTNLNYIAKFSGGVWSALPNKGLTTVGVSAPTDVEALAFRGTDLYVGGEFTQTYDGAVKNLSDIAKFSTTSNTWSALPHDGLDRGGLVYVLAVSGSDLYVGGAIYQTYDGAVVWLNGIAKLSGCGNGVDSDGDGLPDSWETGGINVDGGAGPKYIALPSMGADKNKPSIFIQIDWMQDATHNQKLSPAALKIVVDAFAAHGINLFIDQGPDSIMNYVTNVSWGALSQAHSIPYFDDLGTSDASGNYDWSEFDAIKNTPAGFTESGRAPVFHYVIAAHKYGGTNSTGISRDIGASDLIVSLGTTSTGVGSVNEQAGTLMHELGHNLFLHHGGGDDINYKPNYLSVMNYSFQRSGLIEGTTEGHFDYSVSALPSLNKSNLLELNGLGAQATGYGTRHYCATTNSLVKTNIANGPIDWDCDGSSTSPATAYDINNDGQLNETLTGYNDWAHLKLKGGAIGLCSAPSLPTKTGPEPVVSIRIEGLGQNLFLPLILR